MLSGSSPGKAAAVATSTGKRCKTLVVVDVVKARPVTATNGYYRSRPSIGLT
jgi:hypothetical protein